jgi:hypothetical protein
VNIADAVTSVVDRLTAAGIRATMDERDLNPPCVYVAPPAVAWRFGRGDFECDFTIWAVTGAAGRNIDLPNLAVLVTQVAEALHLITVRAAPADLLVPHQAAPLPAYRITFTEHVRQPREVATP